MGPEDFKQIASLLSLANEEFKTFQNSGVEKKIAEATRQKIAEYFPENSVMTDQDDEFKVSAAVILFNLNQFLQHHALFNAFSAYQTIEKNYKQLFSDWKRLFDTDNHAVTFIINKIRSLPYLSPDTVKALMHFPYLLALSSPLAARAYFECDAASNCAISFPEQYQRFITLLILHDQKNEFFSDERVTQLALDYAVQSLEAIKGLFEQPNEIVFRFSLDQIIDIVVTMLKMKATIFLNSDQKRRSSFSGQLFYNRAHIASVYGLLKKIIFPLKFHTVQDFFNNANVRSKIDITKSSLIGSCIQYERERQVFERVSKSQSLDLKQLKEKHEEDKRKILLEFSTRRK